MKLQFDKDVLAFATSATASVANPHSSLEILANVLIRATENGVSFEASDMESCVRCTVEAEVGEPGEITLQAKKFHDIVRSLPPGPVELNFERQTAVISSGKIRNKLTTQSAEDFPIWPDLQPETTVTLQQKTLKRILSHVLFALPLRDPRKVLLGALFDLKEDALIVVATDGKKLGLSRSEVEEVEGASTTNAIIPQKILHNVHGHLKDEGTVRLLLGQRQVAFDLGNILYLSNRIEGMFPNYEMVIPSDFTKEIRIPRVPFVEAIGRAALLSEDRNNSIIMHFAPGEIGFHSQIKDVGSHSGALEIPYDGEPFDIAFNHAYLNESLRVIDSEELIMKIKQPTAPVVFLMPEDDRSLFLVMPIKLTDLPEFEG